MQQEIPMTDEQEQDLQEIQGLFHSLVDEKYRAGQKEHGGNLWNQTAEKLIHNAIEEAIDQFTYLKTLHDKIQSQQQYIKLLEDQLNKHEIPLPIYNQV